MKIDKISVRWYAGSSWETIRFKKGKEMIRIGNNFVGDIHSVESLRRYDTRQDTGDKYVLQVRIRSGGILEEYFASKEVRDQFYELAAQQLQRKFAV